MKYLSLGEAETKRQQAVEFLRRIGKDAEADEFEDMSPEEYAEHKGADLLDNPADGKGKKMARNKTKQQLQAELGEANDYIEQLEGKLDDIAGIASEEDEDEDTEDEEEDSDDDTEDDGLE